MHVLLLTGDLATSSKVEGAARRAGATLDTAGSSDELLRLACRQPAEKVFLDLGGTGIDVAATVRALAGLAQPPQTIAAFGPHVDEAALAAAAAAGCRPVLPRGAFLARLNELLAG